VLSVLSWVHSPVYGGYSAAKAAAWSQVNSLRQQLAPLGVDMTALHVGYLDTDMAAHVDEPKNDPAVVAATALDGVQQGTWEVVADEFSQQVKSALSSPPEVLYQ
jgi:NAD(P)-dependent dehydrogenase (short-subunit alcohol dehydrogenase family)